MTDDRSLPPSDDAGDGRPDPFDVLRAHVRSVALLEPPGVDADELVASITGTTDREAGREGAHRRGSPRRRRWLVAGVATATVAVGGAGIAAYQGSRPTDPTADVVCRSSIDGFGSTVGLRSDGDPIGECARLWARGDLPDLDHPTPGGEVPRLVACTSERTGTIEVLPLDEFTTCADVGLLDADVEQADPVTLLQRRLERHVAECHDAAEVEAYAGGLLDELGLDGWVVGRRPAAGRCATAAVDTGARTVDVLPDPLAPSSSKETP